MTTLAKRSTNANACPLCSRAKGRACAHLWGVRAQGRQNQGAAVLCSSQGAVWAVLTPTPSCRGCPGILPQQLQLLQALAGRQPSPLPVPQRPNLLTSAIDS